MPNTIGQSDWLVPGTKAYAANHGIPYTGSSDLIPVNPTGYQRVPGLPYPRTPTDSNRNRDLLGNVVDQAMEPDAGAGAQPPRDPYMASLPPRRPAAGAAPSVTTLQPGRTMPFSRADAQALAALDPRALDEAKGIAAMPESLPAKITGSFGGRSFEMQPSARVDRNALARLYAQAQERKGQERQDAVRGQEQSGKERIVMIPGEQATQRRQMELQTEERILGKKLESDAPMRAADIAAKQAQTAAAMGGETRAQTEAGRQPNQEKIAILERLLESKRASPFATTIQGRKDIAAAEKMLASMAGVDLPQTGANQNTDAAMNIAGIDAVMADPGVEDLMKKIEETQQGSLLNSPANREAQNLHINTLNKRLRALAQAQGVDINEIAPQIKARLSRAINKRSLGQSLGSNPVTSFIDSLLGVQPSAPPAELVGG